MKFLSLRLWLVLLSLNSMTGCVLSPNPKKIPLAHTDHTIYFIYEAWHTSILLDVNAYARHSQLLPKSALLQKELQQKKYMRIGWGDGDYFTGKRKTLGAATKALVASDYLAIQVLAYAQDPFASIPAETRVPLNITDKSMRRLVRYLDKSFARTKRHELISLPAYEENTGAFFKAKGHYSIFSNCNTWSSRALQATGLPIRSRLHLTSQSVFEQARAISSYQQQHLAMLMSEE